MTSSKATGPAPYRKPTLGPSIKTPPASTFPPRSFPQTKSYAHVEGPMGSGQSGYQDDALPQVGTDPFVGSPQVSSLGLNSFRRYAAQKDALFVFFYDPNEMMSSVGKVHLRGVYPWDVSPLRPAYEGSEDIYRFLAASRTERPNSMFAAVDCTQEKDMCNEEGVYKLPIYRLYSRGGLVGIYDVDKMLADDIKKFVDDCPVLEGSDCLCQQK